jgi:hypothetical protein
VIAVRVRDVFVRDEGVISEHREGLFAAQSGQLRGLEYLIHDRIKVPSLEDALSHASDRADLLDLFRRHGLYALLKAHKAASASSTSSSAWSGSAAIGKIGRRGPPKFIIAINRSPPAAMWRRSASLSFHLLITVFSV